MNKTIPPLSIPENTFLISMEYRIAFNIRPRSFTGILIHAGSSQENYLTLYMEEGMVRMIFYLVSSSLSKMLHCAVDWEGGNDSGLEFLKYTTICYWISFQRIFHSCDHPIYQWTLLGCLLCPLPHLIT